MRSFLTCALLLGAAMACSPPDCDRPDAGSCGNACCKLGFQFNTDAESIKDKISHVLLLDGGPDGRYRPSMTAEGTLLFADLRPYKLGDVDFIGQTIHHTATHHYNDTINMLIKADGTSSHVEVFSTSQIAGAYGDSGQNYKNIIQIIKALGTDYQETTLFGCPASTPEPVVLPSPETLHASCRSNYTFSGTSCSDVSNAIVMAAQSMSGFSNCGSGEKCGYSITSHSPAVVTGHHETPVKHYKDDISFSLTEMNGGCEAGGYSTSEVWYAVLDDGTNLCNLRNLVSATGLSYTENIDHSHCTQWDSANCAKY